MIPRWCRWAGCRNPASKLVDGWAMCQPHIREHHEQTAEDRASAICDAHAAGLSDSEIAQATGSSERTVARHRARLGLAANTPQPQPKKDRVHGTLAGYRQHHRHGDPTCQPCRDAHAAYKRQRTTVLAGA